MDIKVIQQSNRDLWLSFLAIVVTTLIYLFIVIMFGEIPGASDLFGHGIGILGFILMICAETLYTIRKRSRRARWGRMSSWLQFHIFTGLVGPYMVLLHSSWKFNGLAGIVMLLTVIIVGSGFIGRYIYTSVPRNADGIEIENSEIERQIHFIEHELQAWTYSNPELFKELSKSLSLTSKKRGVIFMFGRSFVELSAKIKLWRVSRRMDGNLRERTKALYDLTKRERNLRRQLASIALTRRFLGLWHAIHIPIGLALFTAAFIHIIAAVYYATLLH